LFASRKPMTLDELREVLAQVDQNGENTAHPFGKIKESDIRTALEQVKTEIAEQKLGIIIVEVAGGFRFQTDPSGGPWVRHLLNLDKPARLSKPALETLAIIAYRQPATRAEIEALRGVNVDAMMRHLLELQLIRIMGRSDLPGRPLMYGTTQLFLEHFGLSSVKNLPGVEQLSRRDAEHVKREANAEHPTPNAQRPMEEQTVAKEDGLTTDDGRQTTDAGPEGECGAAEDGSTNEKDDDNAKTADKDQDEEEYDEDEEEDEDDDEEGNEGRK